MFTYNINPVLLDLGPLEIRWYGLFYVIGFAFGIWYLRKYSKLTKEQVYDFFTYLILGSIIGARLFYMIVYNYSFYLSNPLKIFAVWEGGMSFHGGLLGAIIVSLWFCRKNKINFYYLGDILVVPLSLALFLGRIGNFINGELYGRVTDVWWCFDFGDGKCRHPSQLYEAGKNLLNGIILFGLSKNKKLKEGTLFWGFWILYGFFRFNIEFFRQPDLQIGDYGIFLLGLSMGQILSGSMFIIGIVMLIWISSRKDSI